MAFEKMAGDYFRRFIFRRVGLGDDSQLSWLGKCGEVFASAADFFLFDVRDIADEYYQR